MEEYFKFILYAVLFVIYVVSQVRKVKKKAEEEKALRPEPVKAVKTKPTVPTSKTTFDYKGKREMKSSDRKKILSPKEEHKPVVYKPVADEELISEAVMIEKTLQERRKQEKILKEDRRVLPEGHFEPYAETDNKSKSLTMDWLKDKANLKRTFIAAEIFQRKY